MPDAASGTVTRLSATGAPGTDVANIGSSPAISLHDVAKIYRLYTGPSDQARDVLGIDRLLFWRRKVRPEFMALDGITLDIRHGERVGIIGRNGAGKTTLLKLITGNFAPSRGSIVVEGDVQALMQTGLGFHPEFTGFENIRSSLVYNGLGGEAIEAALRDVIDFCELGEFLHQPVKTYSLGMRSRLQFATATAIRPEILVIDEVLGAGDAYFSAKSVDRMQRLTSSGCTLLLVSHSMEQILAFCQRIVWLDHGRIVEDGPPLPIVKAYQRLMHDDYKRHSQSGRLSGRPAEATVPVEDPGDGADSRRDDGVSRWNQGQSPLRIKAVRTLARSGEEETFFEPGDMMTFEFEVEANDTGPFPCTYVILVFGPDGRRVTWHKSEECTLDLQAGQTACTRLVFDELLLNAGHYVFSAAIYSHYNVLEKSLVKCYDLLSRSFEFQVGSSFDNNPALFRHPARWEEAVDVEQLVDTEDGS